MPANSNTTHNSEAKAAEARFFLRMMDTIERTGQTYTGAADAKQEYTYFLSAFLNACYSASEYMRKCSDKKSVDHFQKTQEAKFYKREHGWRSLAVHHHPIIPAYIGYMPPPGDNVNFRFHDTGDYRPPPGDKVNFNFERVRGYYYFTTQSPQTSIGTQCSEHLTRLEQFIDSLSAGEAGQDNR